MANAANASKTRWNANHYTQVKISVRPELAAAFKSACEASGVSMATKLSLFMADFCASHVEKPVDSNRTPAMRSVSTRGHRRKAVNAILHQMERIRDAEETYRDNIPANLQSSPAFDAAEESIALMDEVIDTLSSIY